MGGWVGVENEIEANSASMLRQRYLTQPQPVFVKKQFPFFLNVLKSTGFISNSLQGRDRESKCLTMRYFHF